MHTEQATASTTGPQPAPTEVTPWLRAWPYTRRSAAQFGLAFLALTAAYTAVGLTIVKWFEPTGLGRAELDVSRDLEAARTDTWNDLATWASRPSDTLIKIALMAILLVVLPALVRRWHDWAFLAGALVLEVSVYGLSSFLVDRPRPPVERLAGAPTESWPSGHVAASVTFYVGLALIVAWHTRRPVARAGAALFAALVVVGMIASRLYLGMHFVSDVVGGVVLGFAVLLIVRRILTDAVATNAEQHPSWPTNTRSVDVSPVARPPARS